jgi:hypothetical protein
MNNIVCPHCGKEVEINQALKHQIEEDILQAERAKQKEELERVTKQAEEKAAKKIKEELDFKLKNSANELEESKKRNDALQEQLLELNKTLRSLQKKDEQRELEMQKQLFTEREKLQEELHKSLGEKYNLEKAELSKQLEDTKRALEDAQRKASQKSQQLQGEVLELELEEVLRREFPHDDIEPIGKGVVGADIRQVVKSPKGFVCGTILWESKRTKEWSEKWIAKLKEDVRSEKAVCAVIVSIALPKEASNGFGLHDGIWVCNYSLVLSLATVLRKNLLDVGYQKAVSANRGTKAEELYSYITSHEFQQQVENVVEVYQEMQTQITKERAAFEKIWKMREGQAQRILRSTGNIIGSMQGVVGGSALPIKGLDLDSGEEQKSLLE